MALSRRGRIETILVRWLLLVWHTLKLERNVCWERVSYRVFLVGFRGVRCCHHKLVRPSSSLGYMEARDHDGWGHGL
jgi:hypothetical protein